MSKIVIDYSPKFIRERKKFVKKNRERFETYGKTVKLFIQNPYHPGLNLEKLEKSLYWSIRLNESDRIFFIWTSSISVLFVDIGEHDKYKKY
ncbi:hypothetical protein A2767_03775 [Candidatus Roizmanbacteria bacterium RIFCSPHIGHO2_01_FULL_35_10]|uniref:Toxin YoeB n=1 Tax=Candidatus Roizmanbacteria bacterium RIFCSPLOWO2_01_FULL_35_13 TaxID=1802055 RepID=A0A1F7IA68_9BACT|nr:MAG: hypothetical protein A2767_03775 [Candidatus Roizmanbacteria bacterium RIFCSPHIGHO2_01_FULL_35_10]OGK40243.1 MAG: hypothetical protein A3A74_07090 [Candidatus Roizmanbacteria bacterium RIFCSPLOWO2_01_FULL_35_13]